MILNNITCFNDFSEALLKVGFSCGGLGNDGMFSLEEYYADNIQSHTDNPETDPWEWRMRVLNERSDIAYAKLFFRKSGYITREWYPYFLSARRRGETLCDAYESGRLSIYAKRIHEVIEEHGRLPSHHIKRYANFTRADNPKFEKALVELQMKMFITICGAERKISAQGEYGWSSSVFCLTESFFGEEVFAEADRIPEAEAIDAITQRIYELNPNADRKKVVKFITGV